MKKPNYLLSIIIPTLNNENMIRDCLECLEKQTYSRFKIEILIVDGGSKDKTLSIAKGHKARVIQNPYVLAEPGVNLGMEKAKGDLLMVLAVDNFFYDKDALEKIIQVFDDPKIYAAFPRHESKKTYNLFTKYINTFTDPFNHFLYGDAANGRTFKKIYRTIKHNSIYDVYDLKSNNIKPLIALAQGFTIRNSFKRKPEDEYDDQKPILELIKEGKRIAYVYSVPLYHQTIRNMDHFLRKQRWATRNALEKKNYGVLHRKSTLSLIQQLKIRMWPIYAFSIIFPIVRAIYGIVRDKEIMWLFHPVMVFLSGYASFVEVLMYNKNKQNLVSRQ